MLSLNAACRQCVIHQPLSVFVMSVQFVRQLGRYLVHKPPGTGHLHVLAIYVDTFKGKCGQWPIEGLPASRTPACFGQVPCFVISFAW